MQRDQHRMIRVGAVIAIAIVAGALLAWRSLSPDQIKPQVHDPKPPTVASADASAEDLDRAVVEIKPRASQEELKQDEDRSVARDQQIYLSFLTGEQSLSELPSDVYLRHIEAANSGDAEAMYWVSKALKECSFAPRTET